MVPILMMVGCGGPGQAKIERIENSRELATYRLESLTGYRDGGILQAKVVFSDDSLRLTMLMRFKIGVPTRLEFGQYRWIRPGNEVLEGFIAERSVTFLGGQSDRPNLGGVFELLSPHGSPLYRVRVPTTEVAQSQE